MRDSAERYGSHCMESEMAIRRSNQVSRIARCLHGVHRSAVGALALVTFALVAAGCDRGPVLYPVTGSLTLDGKPLKGAAIGFIPKAGGRHGAAVTDENGEFVVGTFTADDGAWAGEHTIVVSAQRMVKPGNDRAGILPVMEYITPERYDNPETSGLPVEVKKDMDPVELRLTTEESVEGG